jgi:uncharacterized membrane protein (DUF4010 family)
VEETVKSIYLTDFASFIPEALVPILVTFALSFLIGLEREEHASEKFYNFGGVRTFPIIGLCGYLMARLSEGQPVFLGAGVLVLGALLCLSYRKKLELSASAGMTSEISGLFTFLLGALVFHRALWEATSLTVMMLLLLELKSGLEALAKKIPPAEIFTFTRFLLISAVILPIVPNRDFTDLHFNPFHAWLIVVAISGLSYSAYALGHLLGSRRSILLTAVLGGIYSSTSTTVVLAKRSKVENQSELFSGAIVIASGFMYFRLVALLCAFNWELGRHLLIPFISLGALSVATGWIWMNVGSSKNLDQQPQQMTVRNPLELQAALFFAVLFTVMGVLTGLVTQYLGNAGIYGLSFITGLTDVDPFVMSLTQTTGTVISYQVAIGAIVIATASNNVMKGVYVAMWGSDKVRKQGSVMLIALAAVSLVTLIFI